MNNNTWLLLIATAFYKLADLTDCERQDSQRQDNAPGKRVERYVVEDAVEARNVDNCYEHYERECYGDVHHLVGEESELED